MKQKYNPIVGNEYGKLVAAMKQCAMFDSLPQMMEIKNISDITLDSVHELITMFSHDTGLCMKFSAEICPNCDRLHCYLFVDYPEEEENTVLQ